MKYAELYKDEIVQIHDKLPNCWNNISNFDALSDMEISNLEWAGWADWSFLHFEEEYVSDFEDGLVYNEKIHRLIGPVMEKKDDKVLAKWEIIEVSPAEILRMVRKKRNQLLYQSDWTQQPDVPMDEETRNSWRAYRQSLRDITSSNDIEHLKSLVDDPFENNWPKHPSKK